MYLVNAGDRTGSALALMHVAHRLSVLEAVQNVRFQVVQLQKRTTTVAQSDTEVHTHMQTTFMRETHITVSVIVVIFAWRLDRRRG